ncbi:hypothetical protein JW968_02620 [Candidatus Woesearchaeota archaeon]|nr:hypothetical protein [Candidatus Woesearchaeota archaeon]
MLESYLNQECNRRGFLTGLAKLAGGAAIAATGLDLLASEAEAGENYFGTKRPDQELYDIISNLNPERMEQLNEQQKYNQVVTELKAPLEKALRYDLQSLGTSEKKKLAYAFNSYGIGKNASLNTTKFKYGNEFIIATILSPEVSTFWYSLAGYYMASGDNKSAVPCLKKFVSLEPNDKRTPRILDWIEKNS